MGVWRRRSADRTEFDRFVDVVEPALHRALTATYGLVDGRAATVDALSWAWEHWDRVVTMERPVGYLYRVGQSAMRRYVTRPLPIDRTHDMVVEMPAIVPDLLPALSRLSEQQRTVVVLVHGFGWTQAAVADVLEISPSTVAEHLRRGLDRLRSELEVNDAH